MYAEISAAIQSAKVLGDLVRAAHGLANYNEFVTAVYQINAKLMQATGVALASQDNNRLSPVAWPNLKTSCENWKTGRVSHSGTN